LRQAKKHHTWNGNPPSDNQLSEVAVKSQKYSITLGRLSRDGDVVCTRQKLGNIDEVQAPRAEKPHTGAWKVLVSKVALAHQE
jgi:hypothetical protein